MLTAYLDESGHSAETRFVSVAAFVSPDTAWVSFNERWRTALAEHSAPYLHMREFAHRRGAFVEWTEERRRSLLAALLSAIVEHELIAVGAAIDAVAFSELPDERRRGFVDPFLCCVQEIAWALALLGRDVGGCRAVFSRQDEFASMTNLLWTHFRAREGFQTLADISFEDMRTTSGLQAADLLAYELRLFYDRRAADPASKARWPFAKIVEDQISRERRLLKFLPWWYLELQASGSFHDGMNRRMSSPEAAYRVMLELWPQL